MLLRVQGQIPSIVKLAFPSAFSFSIGKFFLCCYYMFLFSVSIFLQLYLWLIHMREIPMLAQIPPYRFETAPPLAARYPSLLTLHEFRH